MRFGSFVAVALALAASTVTPAVAQSGVGIASVRGVSLGVSAAASGIEADGVHFHPHNGGGLSVTLGYGMSDALSLFVRGTSSYLHAHYDAGARYTVGGGSRLRPYVEGAFTYTRSVEYAASADRWVHLGGPALTAGAGLEYFLTRNLAVDAGFSYVRGRYAGEGARSVPQLGDGFRSGRFTLGLKLRP